MTQAADADILIVDDEPDLRELYMLSLVHEGYACDTAGSVAEARALLGTRTYRAVIVDMRLPDGTGLDILREMQLMKRAERVIVATAYGSADNAVEALKAGAYDYLSKPVDVRQLRIVIRSALTGSVAKAVAANPAVKASMVDAIRSDVAVKATDTLPGISAMASAVAAGTSGTHRKELSVVIDQSVELMGQRLIGHSEGMQKLREFIRRVAPSMAPVLIRGESGTGKEITARALHDISPRAQGPFVAVNCGAIPQELLEAEFFGYRKGAFTGANADRDGFFQAAAGGTLFLDEVAELPLAMQAKLLRALQERRVRMLGESNEQPVDVRVVSATHQDLPRMVDQGRFRQDLFYRLDVIELEVPPLRERKGDVALLAQHILKRLSDEAMLDYTLSRDAQHALQSYSYPGNVRELENLLQRACALAPTPELQLEDMAFNAVNFKPTAIAGEAAASAPASRKPEREFLPSDIGVYIDSVERDVLERALERTHYNRTAAAQILGLTLRQIRYRMSRLGIKDDGKDEGD
jgi:two-component system, NtrC family, response regulator PilR